MFSVREAGGDYATTGGDGRALISNVKPGRYRWFIEALSVTADPRPGSGDADYAKRASTYKPKTGGLYKIRSGSVEVLPGEESEVSEDVGINYF
jgi:hypothetical protein